MFKTVSQEALLALELFRLNPRSKKGQEIILQHLVEAAMHTNPEARSTSEIVNSCLDLLGQPSGFGEAECNTALSECRRTGRVKQIAADEYSLADEVQKELSNRYQRFQEAEKAFSTGLIESVSRVLNTVVSPLAEPLLRGIVRDAIQQAFYDSAIRLHKLLESKRDILTAIDKDYDIDSRLLEKLKPFTTIQKGATPEQTVIGVRQFLNNLDEFQRHYIGNLHRRVFYFQILNIDPRLQELEKQSFTNTRGYLDTNVAITYLCDGTRLHQPVFDILQTTLFLGMKLFVSPITIKELGGLLKDALEFSSYLKDGRVAKILGVNPTALDNPIIDGFIRLRQSHASLNWEAYVSPLRNLEEYLLSYNVVPEEECFDSIENDEEYKDVYHEISDIKRDKPTDVLTHDASNYVLIHRLRSRYPGTPLGSAVWLLSLDTRLPMLDRRLQRKYPVPHCRLIEQWGEILMNFQSVGRFIATDDYIAYLASQMLGAYIPEETLDIHIFESLSKSEVLYDKILGSEPEISLFMIRDLQKDREASALLRQITASTKEEKEEIESEITEKATLLQSSVIEKITQEAGKETARLRKGISELAEQLHELEAARERDSESISNISEKLKSTKESLRTFETMPFLDRLKYLFRL